MLSLEGSAFIGTGLGLIRYLSCQNRKNRCGPRLTIIGDVECSVIADKIDELPSWGDSAFSPNPTSVQGGGSSLNTAFWVHNLCAQCTVTIPQTYSLNSFWGRVIAETLKSSGISVVSSSRTDLDAGISLCLGGTNTERCFVKYAGGNSKFKISDFDANILIPERTHHVHFAGYFNCPGIWGEEIMQFIRTCRQKGVKTISLNPQFSQEWDRDIHFILPYIDFFVCNKHEALTITNQSDVLEAIDVLSDLCHCVVVTLGIEGALMSRKCIDLRPIRVLCKEMTEVPLEDAIGVGDAFCAGFISEILSKNLKPESPQVVDAVRFACACGTAACTVTGGSSFPGIATIRECLID